MVLSACIYYILLLANISRLCLSVEIANADSAGVTLSISVFFCDNIIFIQGSRDRNNLNINAK